MDQPPSASRTPASDPSGLAQRGVAAANPGDLAAENAALRERVAALEAERRALLPEQQPQPGASVAASRLDRDLIRSAHEGVIVYGPDLRYQIWNPFMERLTGKKAEAVLGKHPSEVFPFLAEVGIAACLERALAGEVPGPVEFSIELAGRPGWFVDTSAPLRDATGRVIGVIGRVQDLTPIRHAEDLTRTRLHLYEFASSHSLHELLVETLNEAERLTRSRLGFFHFVGPDERTLSLQAWSRRTTEESCTAAGAGGHVAIERAGVWADAVRDRRPVTHNDYAALRHAKGLPEGHAHVLRELVVPIQREGRVVAILGVGNKPTDYVDDDVRTIDSLANAAWEVAERKRTVEQLRASEQRFRTLMERAPDPIFLQREGRFLWVNPAAVRLFGARAPEELLGTESLARVAPDFRAKVIARRQQALDGGGAAPPHEMEFVRLDGSRVPVETTTIAIPVEGGTGHLVIARDVSGRKAGQDALRRFQMAVDHATDAIGMSTPEGRHYYQNQAFTRLFGRSAAEVEGESGPPSTVYVDARVGRAVFETIGGGGTYVGEVQMYAQDRKIRDVFLRAYPIHDDQGRIVGLVGVHTDITERKTNERTLIQIMKAVESSSNAIGISDAEGRHIYQNRALSELFEYATAEELQAAGGGPAVIADPAVARQMFDDIRRGKPWVGELDMVTRSGRIFPAHEMADTIQDERGHTIGLIGVITDITERRRAEEELARARERLSIVFHNTTDMLALVEVDPGRLLRFAEVNQRYLDAARAGGLALSADDLVGKEVGRALRDVLRLDEESVAREVERLWSVVESRAPLQLERAVESPLGQVFLDTNLVPVLGDDGACTHVLWSSRDVTARRRAEDELRHAQKMEAIGTLASGVAHDFNNILAALLAGLSSLEFELGDALAGHRGDVREMKDLARRGADVTRQLLGLSRRGKYDVQPQDVGEVVRRTIAVFGPARRDVTVVQELAPDLDPALVDGAQLEQVLLNLFINAGHAMPGGGRLVIRGENTTLEEAEAARRGVRPGRFVKLAVADTGTGIDAATLPRIFEPFFSTKAPGQGTGLGLASVYGIVSNHGGAIAVASAVGAGTTFTILLPASRRPSINAPAQRGSVQPGQGLVLVVDDDQAVLTSCVRLLRAMGFEAMPAAGGRAAIELVRRHRDALSLVILDLTMPELSGAATFEVIRALAPKVKVLLASGYSIEGQARALLDRGCDGFIQKPFDAETLSAKIQALR